ncbi:MAG TPA: hypothetical protein VLR26_02640 [Frankiaceae bacterium]|nr:hypothetical protein [Frankiaceae bacterium]
MVARDRGLDPLADNHADAGVGAALDRHRREVDDLLQGSLRRLLDLQCSCDDRELLQLVA